MPSINGTALLFFNGTFLSPWYPSTPTPIGVRFGVAGTVTATARPFTCTITTYNNSYVMCRVAGLPVGQRLTVRHCAARGQLGQDPREMRPLLLAAGERLVTPVREMHDVGAREGVVEDVSPPVRTDAPADPVLADPHDLPDGERKGEARSLRQNHPRAGEPPARIAAIGLPSSVTEPAPGAYSPDSNLTRVDLPAPFGPIRIVRRPGTSATDASSTSHLPETR